VGAILAACGQGPVAPADGGSPDVAAPNDAASDAAADVAAVKCTPGQLRCTDDKVATQTCDESGNWDPGLACTNQTCVNGACAGVCAPGQTKCSGNTQQACDGSGNWATSTTCPVACCSGACVDTKTDVNNCGSCGATCGAGYACGTSYTAFTGAQPTNWVANGSATYDSGDNAAQLTDTGGGEAGTWIYAHPLTIDTATIQFDFYVGGGTGADGMAVMLEKDGTAALGASGGGFGISGLTGFAVELDTYDNAACLDASSNHIGIDTLVSCSGMPTALVENDSPGFTISDGAWHTMVVQIVNGAFTVTANNAAQFSSYTPSGWANGPYYLGFGGGTGGETNYHRVRNVSVKFDTGHCY
jgi:hypothetical protein